MISTGNSQGKFEQYKTRSVSDEVCDVHGCPKWVINIPSPTGQKQSLMCPECTQDKIKEEEASLTLQADINHQLLRTYRQFDRESIISPELQAASFDTFEISSDSDERALNFAKRMCRHYFQDGLGNTVFTGPPGVGKSHLTVAMARALNYNYKQQNRPKSIIFIPVSRLFSKIQDSFNGGSNFTQDRAIKLLSQADLLFLDDLGKENSMGGHLTQGNEWKQRVLFDILDARSRTVINTNFKAKELAKIYDSALLDRVLKGSREQTFVYPEDAKSKRW